MKVINDLMIGSEKKREIPSPFNVEKKRTTIISNYWLCRGQGKFTQTGKIQGKEMR